MKYLTERQLKDFFKAVDAQPRRILRLRDRALFMLTLAYGLRLNEASGMMVDDLDMDEGQVTVRRLKRRDKDAARTHDIAPKLRAALAAWLKARNAWPGAAQNPFLFISAYSGRDGHLSGDQLYHICRKYCAQAGLTVHPHMFRHTTGAMLAKAGMNAFTIQKRLGHASMNNSVTYVELFGPDRRAEDKKADAALEF